MARVKECIVDLVALCLKLTFEERSKIRMMLQNHVMLVYTRINSRGLDKIQVHSTYVHIGVLLKVAYYHDYFSSRR